jgi:proline dehydrogenase
MRLALRYIKEAKIPKEQFEFQLLMGVPRDRLIGELRAKGIDVRIYIPFCEKWSDGVAYLRRRLNANPNFIFYVLRNILRGSI